MNRPEFKAVFGGHYRLAAALLLLAAIGCLAFEQAYQASRLKTSPVSNDHLATAKMLAAYAKLPITFEKNEGQSDPNVKFLSRGAGYTLFLTDSQAILKLRRSGKSDQTSRSSRNDSRAQQSESAADSVVRVSMAGSNPTPELEGLDLQFGKANYLIGKDSSRWRRGVPLYGRVKYRDVYPGIDAVYYGNQSQLETDFVVAPASRPESIQLEIKGGTGLQLNERGDLIIASGTGDVTMRRPIAYQEIGGTRREVAANFVLRGPESLGMQIGTYDVTKPLVIDPVVVYSTYLGGMNADSGNATTAALSVAVDSTGNAYVTGETDTVDFKTTTDAYQTQLVSTAFQGSNAFITKLSPGGTTLVYSTYLGGSGSDSATGIAIDSTFNAYVTGSTSSPNFPVIQGTAIQPLAPTKNTLGTDSAFFAVLDPNGANLLYSTYLGGNGTDTGSGIALLSSAPDGNLNAYIVGTTSSTNFPTSANALYRANQSANGSGAGNNVFVSQIDPTPNGRGLIYSTYLGGSANDTGSAIAVDANSDAYIAGVGTSSNFPTSSNAFQTGPGNGPTAFVARIDTINSVLVYSSFIGSSSQGQPEAGNCIAIDSNGDAYIGGQTYDTSFPTTTGAFESTFPGALNSGIGTGFVAKFNTIATTGPASLVWATYLGGTISGDQPHAIALDSLGNVYLTGETWSGELATGSYPASVGAPYPTGVAGLQSGFVTVLSADGSSVAFSTYYGTNHAVGYGIALDSVSPPDVFIVGETSSSKFPTTTGTVQPTWNSALDDAFIAELSPAAAQGVFTTPSSLSFGSQPKGTTSSSQAVSLVNNTANSVTSIAISFTGNNASDFSQTNTCPTTPPTLTAGTTCTINVSFTPSTTQSEMANLSIAYSGASGSPQIVTLTGTGTQAQPGVTLTPASANFGSLTQGTASSPQTFSLSNNSAAAITITAPGTTVTGQYASDFVIQPTSTCPAVNGTLAASTTCLINVVFTPSTTSSESATLSVSDSDPSSPQTSSLSGSGTAPAGAVTLSPSTLGFGNVNLNSTSPAQAATLSNTKTTTLTINAISITGANASDFAQSNTCGTSVAATTGTCTISVKFTPTTTAAESATLSVSDSDSTSPQTVALSGTGVATGPDFTVSASPAAATVTAHGTVTATVTVNSVDGFASGVMLNCASLPGDSMCTFTQNPLTPPANGSVSTTVTFTTSSAAFASTPTSWPRVPSTPAWIGVFGILALAIFGMSRFSGRAVRRAICGFALLSIVTLASCVGTPSTPTGTYTVKLTGTAGSATHAFGFTLTVK